MTTCRFCTCQKRKTYNKPGVNVTELLDLKHHFHLKYLLVLFFLFCFSVQTVYISDTEMNLAAVKFWGGLKVLTYSSLLWWCFLRAVTERV